MASEKSYQELLSENKALKIRAAEIEKQNIHHSNPDLMESFAKMATVMVVQINKDESIAYINQLGSQILGLPAEEILGKNWFDNFLPPEIREKTREVFKELMQGKQTPVEYHINNIQRANGTQRTMHWHNMILSDENETFTGVLCTAEDIIEQEEQNELLRMQSWLLNSTRDAVTAYDLDSKTIFWGKRAEEEFGYSEAEMLGKVIRLGEGKNTPEKITKRKQCILHGEKWHTEYKIMRKDGSTFWSEAAFSPFNNPLGEAIGYIRVDRNIDERHAQEKQNKTYLQQIQQKERENAALLKSARAVLDNRHFEDAASVIFETCRELIGASGGYIALLSKDRTENEVFYLNPGNDDCTVDPSLPMPIRGMRGEVYEKGEAKFDNKCLQNPHYALLPQGHVPIDNVLFAPLQIDNQNVGLLGLANKPGGFTQSDCDMAAAFGGIASVALQNSRNFDTLEAIDREKEKMINELQRVNQELDQFTYAVSHDLKSPLITIQGFLGFLEQDAKSNNIDQLNEDINEIDQAVNKMRNLIDELLELSRIGRVINPPTVIDSGELAADAVQTVSGRLMEKNIQVEIQKDLPVVYGDVVRLRQVLENLVDNAAKFMNAQPNPLIRIGCKQEKDEQVFFVSDNGIGIQPKYQEKIFNLFEKIDHSSDGCGIGLSFVKRIIELHQGRVWLESLPVQKGTTIYFTLPLRKEDAPEV